MATFSTLPIKSTPNRSSNSQEETHITWDLLHPHFRKLCVALLDIDEWGQVSTLEVLLRYSRCNFQKPNVDSKLFPATTTSAYPIEKKSQSSSNLDQNQISKDLSLLLTKSKQLLTSRNPAVITSVIKLFFHLTPIGNEVHDWILRPLFRCLHNDGNAESYFILSLIEKLLKIEPDLFRKEIKKTNDSDEIHRKFMTKFNDSESVRIKKLRIMVGICALSNHSSTSTDIKSESKFIKERESSFKLILQELKHNIKNPDIEIACFSVEMIGQLFRILNLSGKSDIRDQAQLKKLNESQVKLNDLILRNLLSLLSIPIQGSGGKVLESHSRDVESRSQVKEVVLKVIRNLIQFREDSQDNESGSSDSPQNLDEQKLKDQDFSTGKILINLSTLLFGLSKDTSSKEKEKENGIKTKKKLLGKGSINDGDSRANIYWLIGQYCNLRIKVKTQPTISNDSRVQFKTLGELIGPDLLRKSSLNFSKEAVSSKLEILTFSMKLMTFLPTVLDLQSERDSKILKGLQTLNDYLIQLARFDSSYEIRDRGRFCSGLIRGLSGEKMSSIDDQNGAEVLERDSENPEASINDAIGVKLRREQLLLVLFRGKPLPASNLNLFAPSLSKDQVELANQDNFLPNHSPLTSLSSFLDDKLLPGWEDSSLPNWCREDQIPDPKVRDPPPIQNNNNISNPSIPQAPTMSNAGKNFSNENWNGMSGDVKNKVVLIPSERSNSPASGSSSPRYGAGVGQKSAGASQYKDLDSFLDESSEGEPESEEESEDGNDEEDDEDEEESEEGEGEEEEEEEEERNGEESSDENESEEEDRSTVPPPLPPQNEWT